MKLKFYGMFLIFMYLINVVYILIGLCIVILYNKKFNLNKSLKKICFLFLFYYFILFLNYYVN